MILQSYLFIPCLYSKLTSILPLPFLDYPFLNFDDYCFFIYLFSKLQSLVLVPDLQNIEPLAFCCLQPFKAIVI